jgi:Tfp pilus assembly protein PilN
VPAAQPTTKINLLAQDEFSNSIIGKFLLWALSIGRYIVVFTELIVIISFLSRFKLDRDLTDLNEEINRQKAIILSYGDLEENIRFIQTQIEAAEKVDNLIKPHEVLTILEKTMPPDIKLSKLQIGEEEFQLAGTALSATGLNSFVTALTTQPNITEVTMGSISSKDEGVTIEFQLAATYQK